jgi:hypothetical protein
MTTRRLFVDGQAWWAAPALPGQAEGRPAPTALSANERRRAPASVLLALQLAQDAVARSGHDAATLASVFSSAHGDLAVVDALCATLAADPKLLSPTRFHHSVHNAASGYWAIASGSRAASSAVAGYDRSFAAGLLEAATQCAADGRPLLLVAGDGHAAGALASVNRSRGQLGVALVLSPWPGPRSAWTLDWALHEGAVEPAPLRTAAARALAGNAMADALPLVEALQAGDAASIALPLSAGLHLRLQLQPLPHGHDAPARA